MGSRRNYADLVSAIEDPSFARDWIRDYNHGRSMRNIQPLKYIVLDYYLPSRRMVVFATMSDLEAVDAAKYMLKHHEMVDAIQELNLYRGERH